MMLFLTVYVQAESLPLEGREFGVEFNIPRLLTYSESWKSVSGTLSYFDHENRVEIAFPWLFSINESDVNYNNNNLDVINIDMHYRKFLGEEMNGFYLSGFGRLSHLDGRLRDENTNQKTLKLGVGVGLGYRLFPKTQRFYWGVGLIVGRYLGGENDIYAQDSINFAQFDDMPVIFDVELLKFGYAF